MNALTLLVISAMCLWLAYRYYGAFLAAKVAVVDESRVTPAHRFRDGRDYHPTNKIVLFGHHFAAIAGAGPLIGPVLAAQYGYLPGAVWILAGSIFAGAVHDYILLHASVRQNGESLAKIAHGYLGKTGGWCTALAILFIIIVALAGLAIVVVNALAQSSWGTFTILMTIPIALLMGQWIYKIRPGKVAEASAIGVVLLLAAVIFGGYVPGSGLEKFFLFNKEQIKIALPIYGFIAAVLPVWLLLCPRDYLSTYMKLGTVALLFVGLVLVNPPLHMQAVTQFATKGHGPVVPGPAWPYVMLTIMCGAISGFHSLIVSGTTPKMISNEREMPFIGYGAMVIEGMVAMLALVAACALSTGDYYAMTGDPLKVGPLLAKGIIPGPSELSALTHAVGEKTLQGRTGGSVTLAVGMAKVFGNLPGMKHLMAYWYHFAIMFEALFILTTIDTGTRVARFILQEILGSIYKPMQSGAWIPGVVITSLLVSFGWGYLLYGGTISTIWPMFGLANQLLAGLGLAIATTYLLRKSAKRVYALTTFLPFLVTAAAVFQGGLLNMFTVYLPTANYVNFGLSGIMIALAIVIIFECARKWISILREVPAEIEPETVMV